MLNPYIINYTNKKDFKDNINFYLEKFKEHSVICFRDINLSFNQQQELAISLGDLFGWVPNTKYMQSENNANKYAVNSSYEEDHSKVDHSSRGKDDIIITWHMEHAWSDNPTVAGLWNMQIFNCDSESGKTYFLDTSKIWKMLSKEDQEFLLKCKSFYYSEGNKYIVDSIKKHWLTNEYVINIDLDNSEPDNVYLSTFQDLSPTEEDIKTFNKIMNFVIDQVHNNEDIRIVHRWKQGDILVPDLHKLAHTVTGGFSPDQRYFKGIWTYLN